MSSFKAILNTKAGFQESAFFMLARGWTRRLARKGRAGRILRPDRPGMCHPREVKIFPPASRVRSGRSPNNRDLLGRALVLLSAFVSSACGSLREPPEAPLPSHSDWESTPVPRLSTAEEEVERAWTSTYGNPRPKLTETMSLGTTDLPSHSSGPASLAPGSEESGTGLAGSTEVSDSVVLVVAPTPYDLRFRRTFRADRFDAPLPSKGAPFLPPAGPRPPKTTAVTPAPAKPTPRHRAAAEKSETKRTSVIAPTTPHK